MSSLRLALFPSICALAFLAHPTPSPDAGTPPTPEQVVTRYRAQRLATMQLGATPATVDSLLALLTDSVVYEHPQAGARIVGRADIGAGIRAFLGSTRNARLEVVEQIVTGNAVAAKERVSFQVQDSSGTWMDRSRLQLSVYFVQDNRIARETQYWAPSR